MLSESILKRDLSPRRIIQLLFLKYHEFYLKSDAREHSYFGLITIVSDEIFAKASFSRRCISMEIA